MINDPLMPHQTGGLSNRRKTRKEITAMIAQYESQVQDIKDENIQKLILSEIKRLQRLLEDTENN